MRTYICEIRTEQNNIYISNVMICSRSLLVATRQEKQ